MMHGKSGDTVNRGTVNRGITVPNLLYFGRFPDQFSDVLYIISACYVSFITGYNRVPCLRSDRIPTIINSASPRPLSNLQVSASLRPCKFRYTVTSSTCNPSLHSNQYNLTMYTILTVTCRNLYGRGEAEFFNRWYIGIWIMVTSET